jgi:hypothetical protein
VDAIHIEATGTTEVASYASNERRSSGAFFDRDSGLLGGPSLSAAASFASLRLEMAATDLAGEVDYLGQTQLGLPIAGRSRLRETELGVGATLRLGGTPFFVGVTLEDRHIERRIASTPLTQELHETLDLLQVGPQWGVRWEWPFGLRLALRGALRFGVRSEFDVDFGGGFAEGRLLLPSGDAERAALEAGYAFTPHVGVDAEAGCDTLRPSRSATARLVQNGAVVGSYQYPGSVQTSSWVRAGLRIRF